MFKVILILWFLFSLAPGSYAQYQRLRVSKNASSNYDFSSLQSKIRAWIDVIEVDYLMHLHTIAANNDPHIAAIAYGPIVLAGEMGMENFKDREPYSDPTKHNDYYTYNYQVPDDIDTTLTLDTTHIDKYIQPVEGQPLTFKSIKEGVTLRPLYDINRERYVVYWYINKIN